MATYKEAGVDIQTGDECSRIAYDAAKKTFSSRDGMIGKPVILEGGFSGAMDFGNFYLVQNDDGIGTKMAVARQMQSYDTMAHDLVAMVADDAICVGAEVVSISNTIDVEKVDKKAISSLMKGLSKVCIEQKIVVPGGEIAELGTMVNGYVWNATALGIVEKDKFITGTKVRPGDPIVGLHSDMFRSNGMSLVRHILSERFGPEWFNTAYDEHKRWGDIILTPTHIYHNAVLEMIGRYKKPRNIDIHAIAHITGGGLPGNIERIVRQHGYGAHLDTLPEPHKPMKT
ncbi:phosphoribosylformylglycinamidine cyclo-ligase, partial [Candidatus Peregrinibacteria bacterium]|nr:phosphoribosylformylglycinamidine cyclo-ligase [Candidatus Peregrinibacteria bacterium]